MKKLNIFLFLLIINIAQSQELKTHQLLSPESNENSDLQFLNTELQGKKLVMLGEMTHMYGNIFAMKARIVEYLHKELGYTTIAMEASMYDLWLMNKSKFTPENFNNAVYGVWSSAKEFQRLVTYIEKNNIKVIGFDSQFNNSQKFIDDFFDYLENNKIEQKLDEDDLAIVIEGVLENFSFEEQDIKFSDFEKELNRIINVINKLNTTEDNYYWQQFIKNILACSKDANNKEEILTMDFANSDHNYRDAQMADNLLSYIHRNPNEKIICWADNIHIINNISSVKKPIIKDFISMGNHIKKSLKKEVYSLATLHANDSLLEQSTWHSTPVLKGSFENKLKALDKPFLFISSNQSAMKVPQKSRLLHYVDFTEMRMDQLHDGYIFLKNATNPKKEITEINEITENNTQNQTEEISLTTKGKTLILKGKIIDSGTNLPIPYTTIILKNEEIYRVADDNGAFELRVTSKMLENASASISSMGYESRLIPLKNLTSKIYLSSKFEELDEIVISKSLSPKSVLKKAIKLIEKNHTTELHNYKRHGNIIINQNDKTLLNLELITKDCDQGYNSPYVISQRVEQVKWNKNSLKKYYKTSADFFSYRQNAIRYSNILHKRKYKRFDLNFIKSNNSEDEDFYIIAFKTDRNKWNYTNRDFPTQYTGKVYVNRDNFAIVKVIENWETTLNKAEIKTYFKDDKRYKGKKEVKIKEENVSTYSKIIDAKYYASTYFNRRYYEKLDEDNQLENSVIEMNSNMYDFEIKNVEDIEYYQYNNKKENSLFRVAYDENFWNLFYEQHPSFKNK
ncbi:hypothetical protein LPB136_05310 [Tenacibaculum todarodis]|uniref:Erythromycin esterase n=1 Tax=Tenacibaculum todarodis TaxID=1850252 RepID=A0A1L3JI69_9FLAO|nr:erythromycin esterase family protein [Tenacibaculum todarodis]APG64814.1 hypothetical protein LPB136_05310 [Tenacibaculum todarodis]